MGFDRNSLDFDLRPNFELLTLESRKTKLILPVTVVEYMYIRR